ncbi:hypothetical protein Micbo1qcDRAFT_210091 [Microdochium bolleyi]|uniref:Uncharacterized protein n=1 Tax=Microdochium bolleyi TaxID=196109 RepID=A0A136IK36_9PEZI|nr:hypothetical protein Micbo1qcDRAFT_210091 [Microdochium bolleyi]
MGSLLKLALLASTALAVNRPAWPEVIANPDASGRVPFYGPRLDRPYPGLWNDTEPTPWYLELKLRSRPREGVFDTWASLQLLYPSTNTPGALFTSNGSWAVDQNTTSGWNVNFYYWSSTFGLAPAVPEGNDVQRGTCPESVMSRQCADDVREKLVPGYNGDGSSLLRIPKSCKPLTNPSPRKLGLDHDLTPNEANLTRYDTTWSWYDSNVEMFYNDHGSRTWPIIIVWDRSRTEPTRYEIPAEQRVQMVCVKADISHNGAALPVPSGGDALVAPAWVVLGLAALLGAVLV